LTAEYVIPLILLAALALAQSVIWIYERRMRTIAELARDHWKRLAMSRGRRVRELQRQSDALERTIVRDRRRDGRLSVPLATKGGPLSND
jgi:hypothetical protein